MGQGAAGGKETRPAIPPESAPDSGAPTKRRAWLCLPCVVREARLEDVRHLDMRQTGGGWAHQSERGPTVSLAPPSPCAAALRKRQQPPQSAKTG